MKEKRKINILDKYDEFSFLKKTIIIFCLILVFSIFDFLSCNYKLIKSNDYGNYSILNKFKIEKNDGNTDYILKSKERYIKKLVIKYESEENFRITLNSSKANKYGIYNEEIVTNDCYKEINVFANMYNSRIRNLTISVNSNTTSIQDIRIKNEITFNFYLLVMFIAMLSLMMYLIKYRKKMYSKLSTIFIIIALSFGIITIILEPAITVLVFDDESHYKASRLYFSNNDASYTDSLLFGNYFRHFNLKSSEEIDAIEKYLNECDKFKSPNPEHRVVSFSNVVFMPQAIALKLCDCLRIPFSLKYKIWKCISLFIYTFIIGFAIKKVKKYKLILFSIGLLPTSLFLAANANYDLYVIAGLTLGIAYYINLYEKKNIVFKDLLPAIVAFIFGSLAKAVYIPIIFILMTIPKNNYKNEKDRKRILLMLIGVTIVMFLTFLIPIFINTTNREDFRQAGTSLTGQLSVIVHSPISFIKVFLNNVIGEFATKLVSPTIINNLAYYNYATSVENMYMMLIIILIISYIYECKNAIKFNKRTKLGMLALTIILIINIWGPLYLQFTPVGSEIINGVQPRYFIPLLPIILLILTTDKIKNTFNENKIIMFISVMYMAILLELIAKYIMIYNI